MNFILTASGVVFPLITFPLVSRALGAEMYGLYSWASSVTSWFSMFAVLGVGKYGIRAVARSRDNVRDLARTINGIMTVVLIFTAFAIVLFFLSILFIDKMQENRTLFLINTISIICNTLGVMWFFQGMEQYSFITIRGIIVKVVAFIGVLFLVHTPDDYLIYAALMVGSLGLANLINLFYMLKTIGILHNKDCRVSISDAFHAHFRSLLTFFIISAAISIYTQLDTVMLGFLTNNEQVGFYSAAIKVKGVLTALVSALTGVVIPRASNYLINGKHNEFRSLIRRSLLLILIVAIPVSVILAIFATQLITFYAGAGFAGSGPVLSIVGLTILPIALSILFCDGIMIPLGLENRCMKIYIVAAIIDFFGNLILIPIFGAVGAAMSTAFVETLIALAEFLIVRRFIWI